MRRALSALVLAGCHAAAMHPVPVTVVTDAATSALASRLHDVDARIELRFTEAPDRIAASPSALTPALADARKAYVDADFDRCLRLLGDEGALFERLAAGDRTSASRLGFWRIACEVGAGADDDAARAARTFAVLGLDAPSETDVVTPEVEQVLARVAGEVAAAPRGTLAITADHAGEVTVDGRRTCTTPCRVDLALGDHELRVDGEGVVSEVRRVRVDRASPPVAIRLRAADPELAGTQWVERYRGVATAESEASLGLLAMAVRAQRLVLLSERGTGGARHLRGVLYDRGRVVARAERSGDPAAIATASPALLRELFLRGGVTPAPPPLWRRPGFWLAVGLSAAASAALVGVALYQPPIDTMVVFGGRP